MIEKTLSTGRKVKIKELSIDEMDECKDTQKISLKDGATLLLDTNKARTKWIRNGLVGGDFKNFEMNGNNCPTDKVLRQLTNAEMDELLSVIQEAQALGEEKPSNIS
jgi:hypothetical protein